MDFSNIKTIEYLIRQEKINRKKYGINLKTNNRIITIFTKERDIGFKLKILEYSRKNYYNNGFFNKERNCYYPIIKSNEDISEYNKLEKLFKKWGFKSLQ